MTRWILRRLFIACAVGTAAVPSGVAAPVVELQLSAHVLFAPGAVRITVMIEPNADNRALQIELDGESMYSASELPLEGSGEKRLHQFFFNDVPAGHYTIRAEVRSTRAVRGTAKENLEVIGQDR
jgi:hypothetical protein